MKTSVKCWRPFSPNWRKLFFHASPLYPCVWVHKRSPASVGSIFVRFAFSPPPQNKKKRGEQAQNGLKEGGFSCSSTEGSVGCRRTGGGRQENNGPSLLYSWEWVLLFSGSKWLARGKDLCAFLRSLNFQDPLNNVLFQLHRAHHAWKSQNGWLVTKDWIIVFVCVHQCWSLVWSARRSLIYSCHFGNIGNNL